MSENSPYSKLAIEHATTPRNMGILKNYNGHAALTGPCGDTIEFWVLIKDDIIQKIAWVTDGCASSRAAASITSFMAANEHREFAQNITQEDVLEELGRFPEDSYHCAGLAANTVKAAVFDYLQNL